MANATITVLEADGTTQTDVVILDVARQAAAASKSIALSTEDKAVLDDIAASLNATLPVTATIDSAQLGDIGPQLAANSVSVTPATDRQNSEVYVLVMSNTTTTLAPGEIIADTQQADGFFNKSDGAGVINSLTIVDEAAQAAAIDIIVMRTSTSLGTENSTATITDANLTAGVIGVIRVATTDWITISGASVACIQNIGLPVTAVTGTDDLYFAVLNGAGTPVYAGSDDIVLKIGTLQD